MIPQQFHWVWIGDNPLPEEDQAWMRTWREHHPLWRCTLWAEHPKVIEEADVELPGFVLRPLPPLVNRKFYDDIEQWVAGRAALAARSDIVRYEVVARFGGVYLDTDVECFAPIDEVLQGVRLFVSDEWGPGVGNYMFGAVPNHPAMWTVVRDLGPHLNTREAPCNVCLATGPHYLNPKLRASPELVIFPFMLFNPLCYLNDPERVQRWPEVALGNHHSYGKWYDRTKNPSVPEEFLLAQ